MTRRSRTGISILEVLFALVVLSVALIPLLTLLSAGTDEVENADRLLELLEQAQSGATAPTESRERAGALVVRESRASREGNRLWWTRVIADPGTSFAARIAPETGGGR